MKFRNIRYIATTLTIGAPLVTVLSCGSSTQGNGVNIAKLNSIVNSLELYGQQGNNRLIQQYEEFPTSGDLNLDSMVRLGISFTIPTFEDGTKLIYELSRNTFFELNYASYNIKIRAKYKELVSTKFLSIDVYSYDTLGPQQVINYLTYKSPELKTDENNQKTSVELDALARKLTYIKDSGWKIFETKDIALDENGNPIIEDGQQVLVSSLIKNDFNKLGILPVNFIEDFDLVEYRYSLIKLPSIIGKKHTYELELIPYYTQQTINGLPWDVYPHAKYRKIYTIESSDICNETIEESQTRVDEVRESLKNALAYSAGKDYIDVGSKTLSIENFRKDNGVYENSPMSVNLWTGTELGITSGTAATTNKDKVEKLKAIDYKGVEVKYYPVRWAEDDPLTTDKNEQMDVYYNGGVTVTKPQGPNGTMFAKTKMRVELIIRDVDGNALPLDNTHFDVALQSNERTSSELYTQLELTKLLVWNKVYSTLNASDLDENLKGTEVAAKYIWSPVNPLDSNNKKTKPPFENIVNKLGFDESLVTKMDANVYEWSSTGAVGGVNINWRYGTVKGMPSEPGKVGKKYSIWAYGFGGNSNNESASIEFKLYSRDYVPFETIKGGIND